MELLSAAGLLISLLPCQCAFGAGLHSDVPSSCPATNRTRVAQQTGTEHIVIGEVINYPELVDSFLSGGDLSEFVVNTGGIYLLPEPVPYNAKILSFRGFGPLGGGANVSMDLDPFIPAPRETDAAAGLTGPFFYVLVYRNESGFYSLVHNLTQLGHGIAPGRLPPDRGETLDWQVQKGDLIGAYIPYVCVNRSSDGLPMCPSQINFITNNCRSALYHPALDGVDDLLRSEFREVSTSLNMEAILSRTDENEASSNVLVPSVVFGATAVVILAVILAVIGLVIARHTICINHRASPLSEQQHEVTTSTLLKEKDLATADVNGRHHSYSYASDVPAVRGLETPDGYSLVTAENIEEGNRDLLSSSGHDQGNDYDYQEPYFEPANQEEELMLQLSAKLAVTEISRNEIRLCEVLGSGAFGTVYRGVWSHSAQEGASGEEEVAVKTMEKEIGDEDRIKFLQEATIMAQFKHSNIISLKGVLLEDEMMIVLDLMEGGDLRKHLQTTMRSRLDTLDPFESASTLLSYMRQVAVGMSYLQFKCYVHRDLAARNVLVSSDGTICKIADFGLSRDLQHENFYVSHGGKIPVKWTAPEALKYHLYSTASDVWSYGCVLYEIWSLGEKPFQEISNQEAMKHVMAGRRLPPPPGCPRSVYTTMIQCWHPDNNQRPSFGDVVLQLNKPDYLILKWAAEDINSYSTEMRTLGSPLQLGEELFKELQTTYLRKDHDVL